MKKKLQDSKSEKGLGSNTAARVFTLQEWEQHDDHVFLQVQELLQQADLAGVLPSYTHMQEGLTVLTTDLTPDWDGKRFHNLNTTVSTVATQDY